MLPSRWSVLPKRACDLADLLHQPPEHAVDASSLVSLEVPPSHEVLKLAHVHGGCECIGPGIEDQRRLLMALFMAVGLAILVAVMTWAGIQAYLPGALRGDEAAASRLGFWLGLAAGLAVGGIIFATTI